LGERKFRERTVRTQPERDLELVNIRLRKI
jgi:hypothetical protein